MSVRLPVLIFLCLCVASCASRTMRVPMDSLANFQSAPAMGRTLLVLLPGAYDVPKDYFTHGFIGELRDRGLPVDVIAVDAHVDYYTSQTVVERLHEDIIVPAQGKGYGAIWLAGISLGGFGSLLYVHRHPGVIQGVILLAPYLGARSLTRDIAQRGGLARWQPPRNLPLDEEHEMLAWASELINSGKDDPRLYIGYGRSDRFGSAIRVLADAMPLDRVIAIDGGHDWPTWAILWRRILDRAPFAPSRPPG
ncbi:MAG: alpha/beta hydrolase [Betaproteobacteria bacterium]|nr:alpha/beta hydrolase [Betaproteobacteria bacterium]